MSSPRSALVCAVAIAAASCVIVTTLASSRQSTARLQELTDAAALAGISSFATSDGKSQLERRAMSVAAARALIANHPETMSQISPSPDGSSMSVTARDASGKQAHSIARYMAPTADAPAHQSSNMSLHAPSSGTI